MAVQPVEMSERLLTDSRKAPVKALAEAVWNALDVGADHVWIEFEYTALGAIQTITVRDDGEGMNQHRASTGFGEYGDSWKRRIDARTHNDRTVHGQRGQGRYDILTLGLSARWESVADQVGDTLGVIEIELQASAPRNYEISEPRPASGPSGTTLRIANVTEAADKELNRDDLTDLLPQILPSTCGGIRRSRSLCRASASTRRLFTSHRRTSPFRSTVSTSPSP